jgi:hypothetical protein
MKITKQQKEFIDALDEDMEGKEIISYLKTLTHDQVDEALVWANKKYKKENQVSTTLANQMLESQRDVIKMIRKNMM